MTQPLHFIPADKPLTDAFAVVLADPDAHPVLEHLIGTEAEERYELAALLAVIARRHAPRTIPDTDPLPPS